MKLTSLESKALLSQTKLLVAEERKATLALIEHLREISRRRLFAELGYASLWEFAILELGLSEGAAQRRIQAMRLINDVPEALQSLEDGKLSLSNAAKLQSFRQAEKKLGKKPGGKELLKQVESLSQRECEKKLFEISPKAIPKENERIVSQEGEIELKFVISPELHEKLQRLRGLLAHSHPEASFAELLEYMTDVALKTLEKKKGLVPQPTAAAAVIPQLPEGQRAHLPLALQRSVWAKSQGQCEATTHQKCCSSRYRLQIDHIRPLAQGGANDLENLRILCFHHNQLGQFTSTSLPPEPQIIEASKSKTPISPRAVFVESPKHAETLALDPSAARY